MNNITYLGSFDDRVLAYQQTGKLNIKKLNEILISELFFSKNSQIVINDGYFLLSPIIKQALNSPKQLSGKEKLYYKYSPLFSLIKNNHVIILSRQDSLVAAVKEMTKDKQGIETFGEIIKDRYWEDHVYDLDKSLEGHFKRWPRFDMGQGFIKLMDELLNQEPGDLGLKISEDEFKGVRDAFKKATNDSSAKPREKWETVVKHSANKSELMSIANRAHHYNFGMCLKTDTFKDKNVHVNSIASNLFINRTEPPQKIDCNLGKLSFEIPVKIMINEKFIQALGFRGELYDIHTQFIETNYDFLEGRAKEISLQQVQEEFVDQIKKFDRKNRNSKESPAESFSIGLAFEKAADFTGELLTGIPVVGKIVKVGFSAAEKLGVGAIKDYFRYGGKTNDVRYPRKNTFIDSLKISEKEATKHTTGLNSFS